MAKFLLVNALTNTTFANRYGPFDLQELECTLNLITSDGKNRTVSAWTSDITVALFIIVLLTFAIDHCFFNGRYCTHILDAKRDQDSNLSLEEEVMFHEKEGLDIESGQKDRIEDNDPELKTKSGSYSPVSTTYRRGVHRAMIILIGLFLLSFLVPGNEKPQTIFKSFKDVRRTLSTKAVVKEDSNKSQRASQWSRLCRHPWSQRTFSFIILFLGLVVMLCNFAWQIAFWPAFTWLFILLEFAIYEDLHPGVTVPRQTIAVKLTFYLVLWTIIRVTLLSRPTRLQSMLWKCLKWTHAINWWLFFVVLESHTIGAFVAKQMGVYNIEITKAIFFIIRPSLVAYVCSGFLCDAVVIVRVFKYLWYNDVTNI